jgi:hypothetical protein
MPKVLLYITSKVTWIFLFFGTDVNEKRAHVHVGKKSTEEYCKIWLEPEVSSAKNGTLTLSELNDALKLAGEYRELLVEQWRNFSVGKTVKMITIKK